MGKKFVWEQISMGKNLYGKNFLIVKFVWEKTINGKKFVWEKICKGKNLYGNFSH
jgi:predicted phage-related endonuclease